MPDETILYAETEALERIPLAPEELARRLRVTPDELAAWRVDPPRTLPIVPRLRVATVLRETADRTADPAFARFVAEFLFTETMQHIRRRLEAKFSAAYTEALVEMGGVELVEQLGEFTF